MRSGPSRFLVFLCVGAFLALAVYAIGFGPPAEYPVQTVVSVPDGATVSDVADMLGKERAIRFPLLFSLVIRLDKGTVAAGMYALEGKENVFSLAYRFSRGETGIPVAKVTIPEGYTSREAADILAKALPGFDADAFEALAKPDEGYLFPDTYFFSAGTPPSAVVDAMRSNFDRRTEPLEKDIQAFGKPESDIIVMASILEKEARLPETRRIVAGILWRRLARGMPLQVDATFGFIFGTSTYSPSAIDLKADSPYNTYKYKGLPPGPIGNPGAEAIEDAVTPIQTPYVYYVTDTEGNIYYATTYAEHLANKAKAKMR